MILIFFCILGVLVFREKLGQKVFKARSQSVELIIASYSRIHNRPNTQQKIPSAWKQAISEACVGLGIQELDRFCVA